MKKIGIIFTVFAFVAIILFTGCPGDKDVLPTLTATPADSVVSVAKGGTLSMSVTASSENKLKSIDIKVNGTSVKTFPYTTETTKTETYSMQIPATYTVGSYDILITVTDQKDKINTLKKKLKVTGQATQSYTATFGYNSLDLTAKNVFGVGGSSISITDMNSDATKGDLVYVYNGTATYLNILCSPDADYIRQVYSPNGITYSTSGKKHTKIQKNTTINFDSATDDQIDALTISEENIAGSSSLGVGVATLKANDVLAYQTSDGRKGILKITSVTKGASKGALIVTSLGASIKVQKPIVSTK